jgi:hypothetical protein
VTRGRARRGGNYRPGIDTALHETPGPRRDSPDVTDPACARDRRIALVAIGLALVPVLCVLIFRAGRHYFPLGDEAITDLRVRDVFTSNPPLVGVYSRGFNHPGPLLYWLLAPLSAITGYATWANMVSGAVLQGIAIGLSGWLAFRRGGVMLCLLVLTALGFAYSSFAFGSQFLQPWNPNVAFPFFMLFLLQAWSFATGSRWQLLGLVITGSLLVQLHLGYLALVGAATLWACAVVLLDARRGINPSTGPQPSWRRVVVAAALAGGALWLVVVVQQLTHDPGNLTKIYEFLRDSGPPTGLHRGAGLFAAEFRFPPPWLGGHEGFAPFTDEVLPVSVAWLLVPVALLGIGFLAAWRSRRRADLRMVELAAVNAVVSIVTLSRVTVMLQSFVFYWRVISAVFLVVAVVWAVVGWSRVDERRSRWVAVVALMVVVALFFGARARDDVIRDNVAFNPSIDHAAHLVTEVRKGGMPQRPVLIRGLGGTTYGLAQALFDDLDRAGAPVKVDTRYGYEYGDTRTASPGSVDEVWYVSGGGGNLTILDNHPGGRLVAAVTPLSPTDERELRALQRELSRDVVATGHSDLLPALDSSLIGIAVDRAGVPGVDHDRLDRLVELNRKVEAQDKCRCFVVAYPAELAPPLPNSMGY